MKFVMIVGAVIVLLLLLYESFCPAFDKTDKGDILLWYSWNKKRKYICLWKEN